jgi:sugar phosphate isomerase/epimerase
MKLSCLPVSFFADIFGGRMPLQEWLRLAGTVGLDATDFSIRFLDSHTEGYLKGVRQQIEDVGLRLGMIACYSDFTRPETVEREREQDEMRRNLASAALLGAKFVRVTAGQGRPGLDRDTAIGWAAEGIGSLLDDAARLGLQLVFENHTKPGVWNYADFAQPLDIFFAILDRLRGTSLGVNFDTANTLVVEADPLEVLARAQDRVATVHASDTRRRGILEPVVLGTGLVPFPQIFQALRQAGFDGWICIEEASGRGMEGIRQAVDYVRRTWAASSPQTTR